MNINHSVRLWSSLYSLHFGMLFTKMSIKPPQKKREFVYFFCTFAHRIILLCPMLVSFSFYFARCFFAAALFASFSLLNPFSCTRVTLFGCTRRVVPKESANCARMAAYTTHTQTHCEKKIFSPCSTRLYTFLMHET